MTIWNAIFQAIVQGLTEFLPVSSSGHLTLIQHFTHVEASDATFFSAILHLGTLVAVFFAFHETIWNLILEFFRMIGDLFHGKFSFKNMGEYRRMVVMLVVSLLPLVVMLPLKKYYDLLVENDSLIVLGICFLITSVVLYFSDKCVKGRKTAATMKYGDALTIGIAQGVAVLPGVSRAGSTTATSLLCGLSKKFAVQYSFILGIPAILGAGLLEIKDAIELHAEVELFPVIVGFIVSVIAGFFAIKVVTWLIKSEKFRIFAYYTLLLGLIVVGIGIYELF